MTAKEIKKHQNQRPFKPFSLTLSKGVELPIEHPEFLWLPRGDRLAMISTSEDDYEIVDLIHVVSVKVKQEASNDRSV